MAPPLFLSLPSPPPPLPPLSLHPKAPQALTLAAPPLSSRKHSSVCSVASPRHSDYFDPRAPPPPPPRDGHGRPPPPPPPRDGHGRPPPPPPPQGGQDGRVFASYNIYKGKAALSLDPRPPQFVPLDSGAYKVAKEGFVLLQFAPAVSPRQYDWTRKQVFSLSVWEMGSLLTLGPTDSCEFFHDPFKGRSSDEGKVRKVLKVEPTPDGNGRFFNLSVQNRLLNIDESIYIPITKGEFAVVVSTFNYIIPHLMGWSTFTNSIKPEDSWAYRRPQSGPEYEWRR